MMILIISLFTLIRGEDLNKVEPDCNFASEWALTPPYFVIYPVGVCSGSRVNGSATSFMYVCNEDYTINKEEWDDNMDCTGTADTITETLTSGGETPFATDLAAFECASMGCDYAKVCQYGSMSAPCGANSSSSAVDGCKACKEYPANYDVECTAYVADQCYGFLGSYFYNECDNATMTQTASVSDAVIGGSSGDPVNCTDPVGLEMERLDLGGLAAEDYCEWSGGMVWIYETAVCGRAGTTMPPETTVERAFCAGNEGTNQLKGKGWIIADNDEEFLCQICVCGTDDTLSDGVCKGIVAAYQAADDNADFIIDFKEKCTDFADCDDVGLAEATGAESDCLCDAFRCKDDDAVDGANRFEMLVGIGFVVAIFSWM